MISSWRYLALNGEPLPEKDFVSEKALPVDQHRVRACLDQAVLALNANGNPYEALANLPGMRLLTVTSEQRNPFRIFVRRSEDVLVVLGVTRGGDNDSIKPLWRSEVNKRLKRLLSGDAEIVPPGPLPELPTKSKTEGRRRKARSVQKNQAHSNVTTAFKPKESQSPVARQTPVTGPMEVPITELLGRTRKLDLYLRTLNSKSPEQRQSPLYANVQRMISAARTETRDLPSEWAQELKQNQEVLTELALDHSPLPPTAHPKARFQAGIRALLEAASKDVEVGAER